MVPLTLQHRSTSGYHGAPAHRTSPGGEGLITCHHLIEPGNATRRASHMRGAATAVVGRQCLLPLMLPTTNPRPLTGTAYILGTSAGSNYWRAGSTIAAPPQRQRSHAQPRQWTLAPSSPLEKISQGCYIVFWGVQRPRVSYALRGTATGNRVRYTYSAHRCNASHVVL